MLKYSKGKIQRSSFPPLQNFGGENIKKKQKIKSELLFLLRLNVCETQSWKNTFVKIMTDAIYQYLV